jgi:DNA repair exonuclease SbcCD ATPase subunit
MEPANAVETELLQTKVDAAKSRLENAQVNLKSVLNLLSDLPDALKTGVMRAIETAFENVGEAEKHVLELKGIVHARAMTLKAVAPSDCCPHCSRPYKDATSSSLEQETGPGRAR